MLDSAPDERFDRITRMAKRMFSVPISLVSLVDADRQWFKSNQGLDAAETPREISFCGHALLGDELFVVPNTREDERFKDNPLVTEAPHIRFYAGYPLKAPNGHKLGTLCLIDRRPRQLDDEDKQLLTDLAVLVEQEIATLQLATMDELTRISNRRGFMSLAAHALKICQRHERSATLLMFDLNKLKMINDKFGHGEGDRALVAFAKLLSEQFRDSDVLARLGGDEFVVLLTGGTGGSELETVLARFHEAVSECNKHSNRGYDLSYSVGFATEPPGGKYVLSALMELADQRMYAHKRLAQEC